MKSGLALAVAMGLLLAGCADGPIPGRRSAAMRVEPAAEYADAPAPTPFVHGDLQRVFAAFLRKDKGTGATRVEYASLKWADGGLKRYLAAAAKVAPRDGVDDASFPDANCRLAYWINVYNAAVLEAACRLYPVKRLDELDGFFSKVEFRIGGRWLSLEGIEAQMRRQFPAVWKAGFALCRGTVGSPPLGELVYEPVVLADQLDEQFREFLKTDAAISLDAEHRTLLLSPVFEKYFEPMAEEAGRAMRIEHPGVRDVLRLHAEAIASYRLSLGAGYRVRYGMDMTLNDRDYEKIDWSYRDGH